MKIVNQEAKIWVQVCLASEAVHFLLGYSGPPGALLEITAAHTVRGS